MVYYFTHCGFPTAGLENKTNELKQSEANLETHPLISDDVTSVGNSQCVLWLPM